MLSTGFLQCTLNPDFGTGPFRKLVLGSKWIWDHLPFLPGEEKVLWHFSWYWPIPSKANQFCWDLFWILSSFKLEKSSYTTEEYTFTWMELKESSYESHKSPTHHFLHDSLLFCHQELHCFDRCFDKTCWNLLRIL